MKTLSKDEWKRRRRIKHYARLGVIGASFLLVVIMILWGAVSLVKKITAGENPVWTSAGDVEITEMLLTVNDYSRPQIKMDDVTGVVIHYVGNPGAAASTVQKYFQQLRITEKAYASCHFIVGLEGEIIQCIPVNEIAYASKDRNIDTIAVEYCHDDTDGECTGATYDSLVKLTAKICKTYNLTSDDILRHYDITGADCPKYYVDNQDEWDKFKADVMAAMESIEL